MSLRLRVALAAAVSALVVVGLAGIALVAFVGADERDALEQRLRDQGVVAAQRAGGLLLAERSAGGDVELPRRLAPDLNTVARIWIDGEVAEVIGSFPLPDDEPLPPGASARTVDGTPWRFLRRDAVDALPSPGPVAERAFTRHEVVVEVAVPTTETDETLTDLRRLVARMGLIAVLLAGALGWLLSGAALRPLARLRADAERVSATDDLAVRVADDQGLPEVDELGVTLNRMLDRIAEATGETRVALEASRAFAGNAAHELRTPLTSMQANLEVLERNPDLPAAERSEIVRDVLDQQDRLLRLLAALRLLARGDLQRAPLTDDVDLAALVDDAVRRLHRRQPDAAVTVRRGEGPTTVRGWREGLQVLVDNLLENAAVHGRGADGTARIELHLDGDGDGVRIVVDDQGPGVPPEERGRILERFARGRSPGGPGSGLGLALVDQQAQLHGGRVDVLTSPAGGARLIVVLARGGDGSPEDA